MEMAYKNYSCPFAPYSCNTMIRSISIYSWRYSKQLAYQCRMMQRLCSRRSIKMKMDLSHFRNSLFSLCPTWIRTNQKCHLIRVKDSISLLQIPLKSYSITTKSENSENYSELWVTKDMERSMRSLMTWSRYCRLGLRIMKSRKMICISSFRTRWSWWAKSQKKSTHGLLKI